MEKFLSRAFLFSLPILLIGFVFEISLRQIPNDYKIKKSYLDAHSNEVETLILGSSHSFYGVNPKYLSEKSFNAAYDQQTLEYDLGILKKYENELKSLEQIILSISYFSLYKKLEENTEWRISKYVIYYGIPTLNLVHYTELLSNDLDFNLRILRNYYIEGETDIRSSESGWAKKYWANNTNFIDNGSEVAKRHTVTHARNVEGNMEALESIIEICRRNNIKLLLITFPGYKTYINSMDKKQLNHTIELAMSIAQLHDNVTYYNWLRDSTMTEENFYDSDHLNKEGAKIISKRIQTIIH